MFVKRIRTFWADESSLAINNAAFTVDQCRVCKSSWVVTMNFTGLEQNGQILEVTFSLRLIMIERRNAQWFVVPQSYLLEC